MRSNSCLPLLAALPLLLGSTLVDAAASQRTFVASTGNDTHACSLPQPCRTFAAAIARTSPLGEVIVLDSAGYGAVTINKSVSIIAAPGVYAGVSVFTGDGITVDAPGAVVALRGLSINGQGGAIGINLQHAARLYVESCVISGMGSNGILHAAPNAELSVLDTIVRNTLGTGIGVAANTSVVLDHVRSEHNQYDGFYIVAGTTEATATITDSIFAWNGGNGISVDTAFNVTTYVQVEHSAMANNGGAGFLAAASLSGAKAQVTLTRNAINRNGGDGVLLSGPAPGYVAGFLSENAIQANKGDGIRAHEQAYTSASANTVNGNDGADLSCDGSSYRFNTLGNNNANVQVSNGICMFTVSGI